MARSVKFAAAVMDAVAEAEDAGVDPSDIISVLIRSATTVALDIVTDWDVNDEVFDAISSRTILAMQQQIAKAFEM